MQLASGCRRWRRGYWPFEHPVAAAKIGDEAARLADQQDAGGDVPEVEILLPEAVEAAGGDPGEIERGRAEAADAGDFRRDRAEDFRQAGDDRRARSGMPVAISASARSRRAETRRRRSLSQAPLPFSAQKLSSVSGW